MTFRNTALLFLIFLLLVGCKGIQYYQSGTNPAAVSVILQGPANYYTNKENNESVQLYIINHNSQEITLNNWWQDISIIGTSRFYNKEITTSLPTFNQRLEPQTIGPNDTLLLYSFSLSSFLDAGISWKHKDKMVLPPHKISKQKYHPYFYLSVEAITKVVNQNSIKVRSSRIKINVKEFNEPKLISRKTELSCTADIKIFSTKNPGGNLICKITNKGDYPIPLFNDAGSVRFKVYAYGPNRTSVMFTEYVLDNGKLPVAPISIASKTTQQITIPMNQLLFTKRPEGAQLYWTWNKKNPPISPLVYGKKDIAMSTEFWFGVVVDGQEYLSNILSIQIDSPNKKTNKKAQ